MRALVALALLPTTVWAQDVPPVEDPLDVELSRLRDEVAAANDGQAVLEWLLDAVSIVVDDRASPEARIEAARHCPSLGGVRCIPFLRAAVWAGPSDVAAACLGAAATIDDPASVELASDALRSPVASSEARTAAVDALVAMGRPDAAAALAAASTDRDVDRVWRDAAYDGLERGYPDLVATLDGAPTSSMFGAVAATVGNGVAGGVILSSVGTWGRNDAAVAIGAVGGAAIGVGTGIVYANTRGVTAGQGLRYLSDVGWGVAAGVALDPLTYGDAATVDYRVRQNVDAAYRTAGVLTGATFGFLSARGDPKVEDVLASDLAGYLGAQIGVATAAWAVPDRQWDLQTRARAASGIAGGVAGLSLAAAFRDGWNPGGESLLFDAGVGAQALWIAGWAQRNVAPGTMSLAFHGGFALAEGFTQVVPMSWRRTSLMMWSSGLGYMLGAGVPLLASDGGRGNVARVMLPVGITAGIAGAVFGEAASMSNGDLALIAFGGSVALGESAAIGGWIEEQRVGWYSQHTGGLMLTTTAVVGAGLTALAQVTEPRPADVAFVASSTAWGAWYGVLVPIALDSSGETSDLWLTGSATADGFLLLGGLALTRPVGLDPRDSLVPQLAGVTGAAAGSLVVAMVSLDEVDVARGAVIGSVVGIGAGVAIEALTERPRERDAKQGAGFRVPEVPGMWAPTVSPTRDPQGNVGWQVGLVGTGW